MISLYISIVINYHTIFLKVETFSDRFHCEHYAEYYNKTAKNIEYLCTNFEEI